MFILKQILTPLQEVFGADNKGQQRATWFIYTLLSIIVPIGLARTSHVLRCLKALFGFTLITQRRFYIFMASPKMPWKRLWSCLYRAIPQPLTDGQLLVALDDSINPKTGKKIFACHNFFDHAAKLNQAKYPWAQNIVATGILTVIKGRWACLFTDYRFYHLKKNLQDHTIRIGKKTVTFKTKLEQAVEMLDNLAAEFAGAKILAVCDSWFGNNGLFAPVRDKLGERFNILSRLRSNIVMYGLPTPNATGRPRKYGKKLGNVADLAARFKSLADSYTVNLYGRSRQIMAYESIVVLKTLKCPVRVVWVYNKRSWVALFSTDLSLSLTQIVQYYGARWKIESGFKELKQDIGSASSQVRNAYSVINHLHYCMMASTITWIFAAMLDITPERHHQVSGRLHFAFSDIRKLIAKVVLSKTFVRVFPIPGKHPQNSLVSVLLRLAA